ncbi:MAG: adenosine deaminase [Clostridia bacterium]
MRNLLCKFYLDKEKDIIVNIYKENEDEIIYVLETPNHNTGNLITNLARICNTKTVKNAQDMKIIKGTIPASINGDNEIVYIFRLGGFKIANIFEDGKVEIKAKIPTIIKTLMSQTKNYNLPIEKTIVKSYILKKSKFRTDLHTHMNANLSSDCLIALGISNQIRYPLYYIKKLNLKMTKEQEERIMNQRKEVEKQFKDSELTGKYLKRKIDDNTFINFADFILNNLENAEYNISKIRNSLVIMKDGQAVFTNLEKLYIYRYVFARGVEYNGAKINLENDKVNNIPEEDIKAMVKIMLNDKKDGSPYKNNTFFQDKLLWIAREYQKQGITYTEIADTNLTKKGMPAIKLLEQVHEIMPEIEKETGVKIRFLVAIRRIPLTIIKDQIEGGNYLRENLDVMKAVAKSPYVVGSDFIGEEINDISELQPAITEIVRYIKEEDPKFTIRIHAGENDSLRDNVEKSIDCIINSLKPGEIMPNFRIGHGLYTPSLKTEKGKQIIRKMQETGAIVEFQLTSNVRLNNLSDISKHPIKEYLANNIKCVQGTDGCGFYGVDTIDEQLALHNLLGVTDEDFAKMREVEDEIINAREKYFKEKSKSFEKFLNGRTIEEAITEEELKNEAEGKKKKINLRLRIGIQSQEALKDKIKELPTDKLPIIIAGGSFNAKGRKTELTEEGKILLTELMKKINNEKVYFVIGHELQGYEEAILDISKKLNKKFEIDAIIPKMITEEEKERLLNDEIDAIRISTENEGSGIYKSFNYEIFERRNSVLLAFDGNSPVSNLVQEAKNGKGKSNIC